MEQMELSWQEYERCRRRLNGQLGLVVFALLPLPAILTALGLTPVQMLVIVASLGVSIGILYPMWWRTKHNPLRASALETRTRRIAWVCRPGGFLCGLAATLSWSVGGRAAALGKISGVRARAATGSAHDLPQIAFTAKPARAIQAM